MALSTISPQGFLEPRRRGAPPEATAPDRRPTRLPATTSGPLGPALGAAPATASAACRHYELVGMAIRVSAEAGPSPLTD